MEFVVKMASNCGDRFLILGADASPTVIKFGNLHKIFIMATLMRSMAGPSLQITKHVAMLFIIIIVIIVIITNDLTK